MVMYLGGAVFDMQDELFTEMQREGYDRASGIVALLDLGEIDLVDAWTNWWDEGDE